MPDFPIGASVRLAALTVDPYPIFDRLRAEEPVSWVPELGMWFLTRRDDSLAVLADATNFRTDSAASLLFDTFGSQMLSAEGSIQARFKSKCFPPFRHESIQASARGWVEGRCRELIGSFESDSIELRTQFANPLAVFSIARVLGFPDERVDLLRSWYDDFGAALANFTHDPGIRNRGQLAARQFSAHLMPRLHEAIDGTLLHLLAQPAEGNLSPPEIVSNSLVILFGGIETTESAILNLIWALARHPDQRAEILRDPSLLTNAIEESLRWDAAVQSCTRHAERSTTIRGVEIPENAIVQCMIGAANRDPAHFADPGVFDIQRHNAADHITFGFGRHYCLGAVLARLEASVALGQLLEGYPALDIDVDRSTPPLGHEFRKPRELWLRRS